MCAWAWLIRMREVMKTVPPVRRDMAVNFGQKEDGATVPLRAQEHGMENFCLVCTQYGSP